MKKSDLTFNIGALIDLKKELGKSPFELKNADLVDPEIFGAIGYIGLLNGKYYNTSDVPSREEITREFSLKDYDVVIGAFFEWCNIKEDESDKKK